MNTPLKSNIDAAFSTAAKLNSLVMVLNWRLEQNGYTPIRCGIGIDYGRALMMKAGYKGSGLNDVIWMGDVVNQASNLCHQGNKGIRKPLQISTCIYDKLNEHNKNLVSPVYGGLGLSPMQYEGDVINVEMDEWLHKEKGNDALMKALTANLATPSLGLLARKPKLWI